MLELRSTQITDAALNSGTLPALEEVMLEGTRASAAAVDAAHDAVGEWRVVRMVCRQTRLVVRIGSSGLASALWYSVSITLSVWPNCSVCQRCVPVCGQLLHFRD